MSRLCRRWAVKLRMLVFDKPLPPPTDREMELVGELKAAFQALPAIDPSGAPHSEAAWIRNLNRLRGFVLDEDPREFLRWDVIQQTMFVSSASYLKEELDFLANRTDWETRWRAAIKESQAGHPPPYPFYPKSSGNLIHHAYHLAQFEEKAGVKIDEMDYILEFGGGYGSMCRLFFQLGFHGKYVIFDLPYFSLLQKFYLTSLGIPTRPFDELPTADQGVVVLISELAQLRALLSDTPEKHDSMFVATWSISEIPMDVRQSVLSMLKNFNAFLIAYQHRFGELNNILFFRRFQEAFDKTVSWKDGPIHHLPGNNYLFGKRERAK